MGISTTSCFKIISCAGSNESVDRDDIDASSESKGADKRRWSFRKRSGRHRVLSNTIVTEVPSSNIKEGSEPTINISEKTSDNISSEPQVNPNISEKTSDNISSEPQVNPNISEKTSDDISSEPQVNPNISEKTSDNIWTEEIPRLSNSFTKDATVSTMATEALCEDDIKCESVPDESSILVIQAAVRRFLAQRQLVRYKNVVKLQAAVRGHLVRTHAVGTLRCVQAIVKMQALVRARRAERPSVGEKGVQNLHPTYISIEKLLSNRLARQLLESTPKTKQINIKCDPLKPDSAWNWLERWMSVSSPETLESRAPKQEQDQDKVNNTEIQVETLIPINSEPTDLKSNVVESTVAPEVKENLINIEQNSLLHEEEKPQPANTLITDLIEKPDEPMDLNTEAQIEVNSIPENPVSETEPKRAPKRLATDQPDSDGRKSVFGSRKASNPAFIAAQSRFEELTSKTNPLKSPNSSNHDDAAGDIGSSDPLKPINSSNQDNEVGSSTDNGPSDSLKLINSSNQDNKVDSSADIKASPMTDVEPNEYSVSHSSRVGPNGGSECGTELSITSTLDSPDQSEGNKKLEEEAKVLDDMNGNIDIDVEKHDNDDDDAETETEKLKPANQLDDSAYDVDTELEPEPSHHTHMEHEGSPKSHITVPESQGTPSSQISTNTKKAKSDKKTSSQKRKSWSTSKKSPSVDSGVRSSLEQLPKEPKPVKRRNSFGSPKPEHNDQEQARDSTSNNSTSLPSYMQATESARLKAIANSSPKSSPDVVQDKEIYMKKRRSLPGAVNGGRQGSPRIQRSMSQALQTTKGNGSQEKKWQR